MPDWLVAETMWRMEKKASDELEGQGFTCYQPKTRDRRVHRGRKIWVERFLLGRYLLVELVADVVEQLRVVSLSRGIAAVLKAEERPLLAREHEVARLKASEVRGFVPEKELAPDTPGYVVDGPFYGFPARFQRKDDHGNLRVLVDVLGRLTPLELEAGAWEPS